MAPHTTPTAETTPTRTANHTTTPRSRCRRRPCSPVDRDLLTLNVRLAKMRQALLDTNRIERKAFREHARIENAAAAYARELAALLDERGFTREVHFSAPAPCGDAVLIVQLSDLHFNEQVDLPVRRH